MRDVVASIAACSCNSGCENPLKYVQITTCKVCQGEFYLINPTNFYPVKFFREKD